jgi:hypothetical protein
MPAVNLYSFDEVVCFGGLYGSVDQETAMSDVPRLIEDYVAGPQLLRKTVDGMSREQMLARPVAGKWSTLEVVCHLADSEQSWAHRMKRVIAEERPLLIGYDETHFAKSLFYHEHDVAQELTLIEQTRLQMASVLRKLSDDAWSRAGVHTERGLVTLKEMLEIEVEHIPHHVRFIEEKRRILSAGK